MSHLNGCEIPGSLSGDWLLSATVILLPTSLHALNAPKTNANRIAVNIFFIIPSFFCPFSSELNIFKWKRQLGGRRIWWGESPTFRWGFFVLFYTGMKDEQLIQQHYGVSNKLSCIGPSFGFIFGLDRFSISRSRFSMSETKGDISRGMILP